MIQHHADDSLLMPLAAGTLARGPAAVVAAHVEQCVRCRGRLREFEAVGGVLLEKLEPAVLAPNALAHTLTRIETLDAQNAGRAPVLVNHASRLRASLPEGLSWPRSLRSGTVNGWRRLGPGVRWSRVTFEEGGANLHLLRVAAGKHLPVHGHQGGELSQVLYGEFHDCNERFSAGDFVAADDRHHHRPVVSSEMECICLISVEGHVAFDGPLARLLGSLLGM